jgi:hypothetical protein
MLPEQPVLSKCEMIATAHIFEGATNPRCDSLALGW